MPLRDHFRPPLDDVTSWEGFHGGWPMVIVQALGRILPPRYVASPRVHTGSFAEIDVGTFENDLDEYEVRVYDRKRGRRLVAAIEIVSPANKDRQDLTRVFSSRSPAWVHRLLPG